MSQDAAASALSRLSVGIVMPLYPPHFPYARLFVASTRWCGATVAYFPTFSSVADVQSFDPSWKVDVPRLEDGPATVPLVVAPSPHNPATFKKWHGLRIVFSRFASIRIPPISTPEGLFFSFHQEAASRGKAAFSSRRRNRCRFDGP